MFTKNFTCEIKAVAGDTGTDLEAGQFEAIVSAFGNRDSYGDVVVKGAFKDDLKRWKASGDPIPIVWSHRWDDPFSHIGFVLDAKETDEGLWIKGQIDLDAGNATAVQVHRLMKGRRVKQFSFAYDVMDGGPVTKKNEDGEDESYFELRKLKTYEVGPCLVGVNQETSLIAAKAHGLAAKAGRVLSAKNLSELKDARDALNRVIAAQEREEDEDEKSSTDPGAPAPVANPSQSADEVKDEEPVGAKSDEPSHVPDPRRRVVNALASIN